MKDLKMKRWIDLAFGATRHPRVPASPLLRVSACRASVAILSAL